MIKKCLFRQLCSPPSISTIHILNTYAAVLAYFDATKVICHICYIITLHIRVCSVWLEKWIWLLCKFIADKKHHKSFKFWWSIRLIMKHKSGFIYIVTYCCLQWFVLYITLYHRGFSKFGEEDVFFLQSNVVV